MNWKKEGSDALLLRDAMEPGIDIDFEGLASHGIVLDPLFPLPRGPSMLNLVKIALEQRAEMYRKLHELEFPTD